MKAAAICLASLLAALLAMPSDAAAQYAYPTRGQSEATQASDQKACSAWATKETGYDPAKPPPAAAPAPVTGSGARARGAVAGAVIGGVSGGDAAEGAVAGAVVGGVARRGANRRAAASQTQAAAQHNAAFEQARAACLSGRGYSVK